MILLILMATFLEMEFAGRGNGWTEVTDWLRIPGLTWHRGFPGPKIVDLIADVGTLDFSLDNSQQNSAKLLGYYSPDHANRRAGFELGVGVRVRVTVGAETFTRFTGVLASIDPVPGKFGPRTVSCEAISWMEQASRIRLANLPVLVNQPGDVVFQTLIDSVPAYSQPLAIEKGLSADIFPYTLDRTRDEQTRLYDELYRLALSGLDRIWERGNGTLVYEPRTVRAKSTTNADTFVDHSGFDATRSRTEIINKIQTTVHPRKPGTAASVLYTLDRPIAMSPGVTVELLGPWSDPDNRDVRVGAVTLVSLVSTTDYLANTQSDGSGTDLTSFLTVQVGLSGNATKFTITLGGSSSGYLTKLQQRGTPLLDYGDTIGEWEDAASIQQFGLMVENIDLPYQADPAFALEVSQYFVYRHNDPTTEIDGLNRLVGELNTVELLRSLRREISDRIALTDSVTGINRAFFVNAIDETIGDGWVRTTFSLIPADMTGYWLLEVVGRSELDQTTILGFGLIVGHTDVAHGDTHGDIAHVDSVHIDTHTDTHGDAAHGDSAHSDTHGDVAHSDTSHSDTHGDVAHTDTAHVDSHSDTAHVDVHSDVAHTDSHSDTHTDVAHTDVAHSDVAHSDVHDDQHADTHGDDGHSDVHDDLHDDSHTDTHIDTHSDVAHSDGAHGDVAHDDVAHTDSHSDVAHVDTHTDTAHADTHTDTAHVDVAHSDTHSDVAHDDVLHTDTHDDAGHSDQAHVDTHDDVAHNDVPHQDSAHSDSHTDTAHGDAN